MIRDILGLLIGFAVLFYFMSVDKNRTELHQLWQSSLKGQFGMKRRHIPWWDGFFLKAQVAKVSMSKLSVITMLVIFITSIVVSLVEESGVFGIVIGFVAGIAWSIWNVNHKYDLFKSRFSEAFFTEAVPIASHTLRSSGRLEDAFQEVSLISRNKRVQAEFRGLSETWKQKGLAPVDAFLRAANDWGIPEITQLAVITKECSPYNTDLADLWLGFKGQIETNLQRKRMLTSKTKQGRRNGMIYAGLVLVMFGAAYPHVQKMLPHPAIIGFWVTSGIIVTGAILIWRTGSHIMV